MNVLGISAGYHDAAAALVSDGMIIAAAEEERFSREKHDSSFPISAIASCLHMGGITPRQLDYVAWYERPYKKLSRALLGSRDLSLERIATFGNRTPSFLHDSVFVSSIIRKVLNANVPIEFVDHHMSHAASAFFPSGFPSAAIITCDGVGEWTTNGIWFGSESGITAFEEMRYPHSLGLFYSAITQYCGFKPNEGEYKLMGLAAYGDINLRSRLEDAVIALYTDGSYRLNERCFSFESSRLMFTNTLQEVLGVPPRLPGMDVRQFDRDLAASTQAIIEDILLIQAARARAITGSRRLCLAGGVALNCVANGKIARSGLFEKLWVQPASSDAGGALGAALYVCRRHTSGLALPPCSQQNSYLGPTYSDEQVSALLRSKNITYKLLTEDKLCDLTAASLADGKIVGWFQGRMEFGPRALGNRSILADPRRKDMKAAINSRIKHREGFRPFAPVVTESDASSFFELPWPSPYMLEAHRVRVPNESGSCRAVPLPAITHHDGTARVQTVSEESNPLLYSLLRRFELLSGVPVLLNTSFNDADEPIVCTPEDALRTAIATNLDLLVIGSLLITKDALEVANPTSQARETNTGQANRRTSLKPLLVAAGGLACIIATIAVSVASLVWKNSSRVDSAWKACYRRDGLSGHYPLY